MSQLRPEEGVAFRDFFKKIPRSRLEELMRDGRPAPLTPEDILKNGADAIARLAAMHAGYDAAVSHLFALAGSRPPQRDEPGFQDMS